MAVTVATVRATVARNAESSNAEMERMKDAAQTPRVSVQELQRINKQVDKSMRRLARAIRRVTRLARTDGVKTAEITPSPLVP